MEILVALLSNNKVYVLLGFVISSVLFCHSMLPRKLKGPLNWPLLGMLPSLFLHLGDIYEWTTQMLIDCSGTLKFKAPWMTTMFSLVTADPKNIEYLTKTRFANFPKGDYYKSIFDDLLGDGILNTDGDQWAWERRMTSSILHSSDYKSHMIQTVEELVQLRLLPVLEDACRRGSTVDLQDLLTRFTVDNMCIVGLGVDLGCLARDLPSNQLARAFEEAVAGTLFRFITPSIVWKTMRFLGLGTEAKLRESLDIINKFMEEVIVVRRQEMMRGETKVERWDYLSKTMLLRDDQGRYFSNKFVRDLSINFVLAGRDTMSVALSWFFWLLIQHPSVEQKIVLEIRSILTRRPVLEGRLHPNDSARFTLEELKEMNYLHAALSETLRLYPSLPINFKEVIEDEVLPDGTCLKKGETILYPIYSMGRMENIWGKDCREFKPERWVKDGVFVPEGAPKYLTFNGGPRVCLGKDFAFVHMKWVAAVILCRYSLKMDSAFVVEPKLGVTTCMKNGLLVALHPR